MNRAERKIETNTDRDWVPGAILLSILAAAVFLRVYQLDSGLWLDEILTYVNYAKLPLGEIVTFYDSENQHFLYSLLARISLNTFGETNWSLRLPAVMFGVMSIPALYLLGREVADERQALLSAGLMTFSYHHIWFSQNARGYSGLLFWSILSSWLLLKAIRQGTYWLWILYAVTAALGVYTHLTMVFLILGQFCVYLLRLFWNSKASRTKWLNGAVGFVAAGLIIFVLHAPVLSQMAGTIGGTEVSVVSEWKNPLWTLWEILKGLQVSFSSFVIVVPALIVFTWGLISYFHSRPEVVILLVVPAVIGAGVVVAIGHHLWPRFFFFLLGFGLLVVIRGTMSFGGWFGSLLRLPERTSIWIGTGLCLGLIMISTLSVPLVYGPKQDYIGALEYIDSRVQAGDSIVAADLAGFVYDEYFETGWQVVETAEELEDIRVESNRTWLVYTFEPVLESVNPELVELVQKEFKFMQSFGGTVGGGEIYVFLSATKRQ